jgi:hypothetical protein
MSDSERDAFEAAYLVECLKTNPRATVEYIRITREGDEYMHSSASLAWRLWQAARRSAIADAEKWRAIIGCARIRPLGSAGLEEGTSAYPTDYGHMGVDLWTQHAPYEHSEAQREIAVRWLNKFVEKAQRIAQRDSTVPSGVLGGSDAR